MRETSLTWDSIIDRLGGTGEVAGALAQSLSTVSGWRSRGIPSPHWGAVVRLARSKEKSEIGFEALADLAALRLADADGARA